MEIAKYLIHLFTIFTLFQLISTQNCGNVQKFPSELLQTSGLKSLGFDPKQTGSRLWPQAVIPFTVDNSYSAADLSKLASHLNSISSRTCVEYQPITDCSQPFMQLSSTTYFTMGRGMPSRGPMRTAANRDYLYRKPGSMAHALLHVLGFMHEEQRADAAEYLNVGRCGFGFGILPKTYPNGLAEFDYSSVMLNIGFQGCRINATQPPIEANNAILRKGHANHGVTDLDIKKINSAYKCA